MDLELPDMDDVEMADAEEARQALQNLRELHEQQRFREIADLFLEQLRKCRSIRVFLPRRYFYTGQFYQAFGFTPTEAENLLRIIGRRFRRRTRRSMAMYTPEILMMSLRMLRTGGNFWDAGFFVGGSRPTAIRCFWQFIEAVLAELGGLITLNASEESWKHHATVFQNRHGISNVVGAIDGSYIMIRNIGDTNVWFCRKRFPAINLTMVVSSDKQIRFVSCRWPGSMHDANVYRNTQLAVAVRRGWAPFPGAVIVGDSAYIGVDRFVLPHPREIQIQPHQFGFYQAHRDARNIVERVYGEMKGKFGILSKRTGPMNFRSRRSCSKVIKACCFLYNFLLGQKNLVDDSEEHDDFPDLDPNQGVSEQLINIFNN